MNSIKNEGTVKMMMDDAIRGNEIIDINANKTLYSALNIEDFPCFAALMSAGFDFPDLLISFIISVIAGVVAYYICEWLDGEK